MNDKAWNILNDEEQTAITLTLSHGKSSWEAGEIMNKAHYKFLEIKGRAEKFIKMFTEYFDKTGELVPEGLILPNHFQDYLELLILKRKSLKETIEEVEDNRYKLSSTRNTLINEIFEKLKGFNQAELFIDLLIEFDRWNNFRILPPELQEPSAFKRRNKSRDLKRLKNICGLPEVVIVKILERYKYVGKYKKLYIPIIAPIYDEGYLIIPVKFKTLVIIEVSKLGLPLFSREAEAKDFADLVYQFIIDKKHKTCNEGLKFWPEFRVKVGFAYNHEQLNNIIPTRTFMENSYQKLDLHILRKRKKKKARRLTGEKPIDNDSIFWNK
jgi:hypothetical protein